MLTASILLVELVSITFHHIEKIRQRFFFIDRNGLEMLHQTLQYTNIHKMYSILLQLFTKQKKTDISTKHKTIAITNVVFII